LVINKPSILDEDNNRKKHYEAMALSDDKTIAKITTVSPMARVESDFQAGAEAYSDKLHL
jgi:hypothetical protein